MNPYKSKQWRAGYEAGRNSINEKEKALIDLWRRSHDGQCFAEAHIRHCEVLMRNVVDSCKVGFSFTQPVHVLTLASIISSKKELNTLCPGIVEDLEPSPEMKEQTQ